LQDYHARDAFFKRISENSLNVLTLTEGLLAYLKKEEVEKLATVLHKYSNFTYWISDISRPKALIKMKKYYSKYLKAADAMMHFAPENGTGFYKPLGWICEDYRSAYEEGRKINRKMMFDWILRFYAKAIPPLYRKIMKDYDAGMVLLRRSESL
jgi:O-methyltransferase involved in polyketide biosynthesis